MVYIDIRLIIKRLVSRPVLQFSNGTEKKSWDYVMKQTKTKIKVIAVRSILNTFYKYLFFPIPNNFTNPVIGYVNIFLDWFIQLASRWRLIYQTSQEIVINVSKYSIWQITVILNINVQFRLARMNKITRNKIYRDSNSCIDNFR